MEGKYDIGDIVKYNGKLYKIIECHAINWFSEHEPIIYGLILAGERPKMDRGAELFVRESLIKPLTPKELFTWRLLYGKS